MPLLADHGLCFLYLAQVGGLCCLGLAGTRSIPPLGCHSSKGKRAAARIVKGFFLPISIALDVQTMFSLLGSGGGALLPVPGWDQENFPSTFAIQAKEKSAAARIAKGSKKGSKN